MNSCRITKSVCVRMVSKDTCFCYNRQGRIGHTDRARTQQPSCGCDSVFCFCYGISGLGSSSSNGLVSGGRGRFGRITFGLGLFVASLSLVVKALVAGFEGVKVHRESDCRLAVGFLRGERIARKGDVCVRLSVALRGTQSQ